MTEHRWCERHPIFTRWYMPVVLTLSFLVQVWEVTHR